MIELIQFPHSPFCIVIRRILEFSQQPFKTINIPPNDRSLVWRISKQRYYQVPLIKDGKLDVFELDDDSQVIAKYIDEKFSLGLFPVVWSGVQDVLWRYFEHDIESAGFKLNDIHYQEFLPKSQHLDFLRFKERKFGRGCIHTWEQQKDAMLQDLFHRLMPCEQMLFERPYLLGERPFFVDFNLYGMMANFLYSGRYELPKTHNRLSEWYKRMTKATIKTIETI
jgi:glutathione S-transferase